MHLLKFYVNLYQYNYNYNYNYIYALLHPWGCQGEENTDHNTAALAGRPACKEAIYLKIFKKIIAMTLLLCLVVGTAQVVGATSGLDYSELEKQIGIANGLKSYDYTKESWKDYTEALNKAVTINVNITSETEQMAVELIRQMKARKTSFFGLVFGNKPEMEYLNICEKYWEM